MSMLRDDAFPRRKKEFLMTREERFRNIFPILLPSHGILFRLSCFMLVWSNGIVCIVRTEFSLSRLCLGSLESFAAAAAEFFLAFLNIKPTTWTCWRPVMAWKEEEEDKEVRGGLSIVMTQSQNTLYGITSPLICVANMLGLRPAL